MHHQQIGRRVDHRSGPGEGSGRPYIPPTTGRSGREGHYVDGGFVTVFHEYLFLRVQSGFDIELFVFVRGCGRRTL